MKLDFKDFFYQEGTVLDEYKLSEEIWNVIKFNEFLTLREDPDIKRISLDFSEKYFYSSSKPLNSSTKVYSLLW